VIAAPARSTEQRDLALKRANMIRIYRAELKRAILDGTGDAGHALAFPPDEILTMKLEKLLVAIPGLGKVKAREVMRRCRISEAKTVGGMSDRQRAELLTALRGQGRIPA